MANKRRHEEEDKKEQPGSCSYCRKTFDNLSTFLRHVSHSKLCLEDHDPTVIKDLRQKARLKSKRKSFHKNAKPSRKGQQKKAMVEDDESKKTPEKKTQQLYASIQMRHSDAGKAFKKLFEGIYDGFEDIVKSKLEKFTQKDPYVKSMVTDKIMDLFFNEEFERTSRHLVMSGGFDKIWNDGDAKLNKTFEVLESKYEAAYDKKLKECQENWVTRMHHDMDTNLFHYSWHKALCDYYYDGRFMEAAIIAQDNAMDKVFFDLLPTEGYFEYEKGQDAKLEDKFSKAYLSIFTQEFGTFCCNLGIETELKTFLEQKWERKFRKFGLQYHDL